MSHLGLENDTLAGSARYLLAEMLRRAGLQPDEVDLILTTFFSDLVGTGPASFANSVITASGTSVAVGLAKTLTLQAKKTDGTNVTTGGLTVVFSASGGTSVGTISATTDQSNGTYTASFTGLTPGTPTTIHARMGTRDVPRRPLPQITVTA